MEVSLVVLAGSIVTMSISGRMILYTSAALWMSTVQVLEVTAIKFVA